MHIPQNVRQFHYTKALIVVSGLVGGRLLLAHAGTVEEVFAYKEPKITYSDNEGRFVQSGKGQTYAIGGVLEGRQERRQLQYANVLLTAIRKFTNTTQIDEVYLCAPRKVLALLERRLPPEMKRRVYTEIAANLAHKHPIHILKRITQAETTVHPYTDTTSLLHTHPHLGSAQSGANTLARHNIDRVLVKAMWQNK